MSGKNRRTWCFIVLLLHTVLFRFATTHGAFSFSSYARCFFVLTKKHHGNVVFYLEIGSAPFTTHGARGASRCSRCFFGTPSLECPTPILNQKESCDSAEDFFSLCTRQKTELLSAEFPMDLFHPLSGLL